MSRWNVFIISRESNDDEQIQAVGRGLLITQEDFKDKAINYTKYIQAQESAIVEIDAEIKRLQHLKKSRTNKIELLKSNLSNFMKIFNIDKVDLGIFKLSLRKSSSVEIAEGAAIPENFQRIIPAKVEADKVALKKALDDGSEFPGITIKNNLSLQIK